MDALELVREAAVVASFRIRLKGLSHRVPVA